MKNYEKYAEKIREYNGDSICTDFIEPYILKSINAKCINTGCVKCHLYRTIWLLEDYEEPEEPEVDWNKVEVDTLILVRDDEDGKWSKRYFAKYKDGKVYAWNGGRTGQIESYMTPWKYAKLAEGEKECEEPKVDWSKVEVDTPILVRDGEDEEWIKQHFAECDGKVVCAWRAGKTSWTEDCVMGWNYAKLAESEEE